MRLAVTRRWLETDAGAQRPKGEASASWHGSFQGTDVTFFFLFMFSFFANRLRILINLCCRGKSQRTVSAADGRVEEEADSRRRSRADSINLSILVFSHFLIFTHPNMLSKFGFICTVGYARVAIFLLRIFC